MQGDTSPGSFFDKYETIGKNPKVLILAEFPNTFERKSPKYMDTPSGKFLRTELTEWTDSYTLGYIPEIDADADLDIQLYEVKNYIQEHKFETVILFGRVVYESMLPSTYWKGESYTKLTKKRPYAVDGVRYAAAFHPAYIFKSGEQQSPQYADWKNRVRSLCRGSAYEAPEIVPWRIVGLDQLQATLFEYMDEPRIGFDYEGTSLSPYSLDFDILGFSLATSQKAVYVSFDREMTQPEKLMLSMFLIRKASCIWTYNVSYESKVTWARITKKLTPFQDAYTLCKIDGSHGRLKDNARKYVEADFWEEAIGEIVELFELIFAVMTKARKASEEIYTLLIEGKILEAKKLFQEDEKKYKLFRAVFVHIDSLAEIITFDQIKTGLSKYPKAWAAAPVEMMGEYCCYDSYYTVRLVDTLLPIHEHAYQYYITQSWAASAMESFGLNWNDTVASSHEAYYITEAKDCLFKLINLLDFRAVPVKDKKTDTITIMDLDDENRILAQSIYYDNQKSDADKLDALKDIFNPLSNLPSSQIPFWTVYNSDLVTAITMFMSLEEGLQAHPNIPDKSIELIDRSDLNKTISNLMSCDWKTFAEIQDGRRVRFAQRGIRELVASLPQKVKEHTGKFSSPVMEWQFRALVKYGKLNIDEPETWPKEFTILYYLRRFKKVIKSRSTYINGKVGRSNVWLSKVTDYNSPPIRTRKFFDVQKENDNNYILKPDERWILDTNFNVNGANTRRWTAAIHVVPAASELREIYERRFPTSLFLHFDYSQAEIRLLAAMSGDDNLLRAFREGMDIHLFIASKVFKKPMSEVKPNERKFSKSCSFAIIYGMAMETFAAEYTGGNLPEAVRLFDEFYSQFPKIKVWMEARQKETQSTGRVHTIFGDPLILDMSDPTGALRDGVNWPIQSSSSSIAAHCIWKNYETACQSRIPVLPMVFTHDSHDMEFDAKFLFETIDNVHENAIEYPLKTFGTPMKIDWEIGVNQADSIVFEEKHRDDNTRKYEFSCTRKAMNDVFPVLERFFDVKHEVTEEVTKKDSLEQMFQAKKAFNRYLGVERAYVKGEVELTRRAA